jgi:hypothetical protein
MLRRRRQQCQATRKDIPSLRGLRSCCNCGPEFAKMRGRASPNGYSTTVPLSQQIPSPILTSVAVVPAAL